MNRAKVSATDYINFLIATPSDYSCTEASRVQPLVEEAPSHDAITRFLHRHPPTTEQLWQEAQPLVNRHGGILSIDETVLDKFYATSMELVQWQWSGRHARVVKGISLTTLLWTDGDCHIPCDYRLYEKQADGKTKNAHCRDMLTEAARRGFEPRCVAFDSWFSSLGNLKHIRDLGWVWLTRLRRNRLVNPDNTGNRPLCEVELPEAGGTSVHLKGYGFIQVFKTVAQNGNVDYWATNDLSMNALERLQFGEWEWLIEDYHRGLKQCCGVDQAQVRSSRGQRNHIDCAIRAFLRFEKHFYTTGVSWYEAKRSIVRHAVRQFLSCPQLDSFAYR